jgi:hypothetical protein
MTDFTVLSTQLTEKLQAAADLCKSLPDTTVRQSYICPSVGFVNTLIAAANIVNVGQEDHITKIECYELEERFCDYTNGIQPVLDDQICGGACGVKHCDRKLSSREHLRVCGLHGDEHLLKRAQTIQEGEVVAIQPCSTCIQCSKIVTERQACLCCQMCGRAIHDKCFEKFCKGNDISRPEADGEANITCAVCVAQRFTDLAVIYTMESWTGPILIMEVQMSNWPSEAAYLDWKRRALPILRQNTHFQVSKPPVRTTGKSPAKVKPAAAVPAAAKRTTKQGQGSARRQELTAETMLAFTKDTMRALKLKGKKEDDDDEEETDDESDSSEGSPVPAKKKAAKEVSDSEPEDSEDSSDPSEDDEIEDLAPGRKHKSVQKQLAALQKQVAAFAGAEKGNASTPVAKSVVSGKIDGFKYGQAGSPTTVSSVEHEGYLAMNAVRTGLKNRNKRVIGADRADQCRRNMYTPEATRKDAELNISGAHIIFQESAFKVPDLLVFRKYCQSRIDEVGSIRSSGLFVFKKKHDMYDTMQQATALILGRYKFMMATINYMLHEMTEQWGLVWRYICALVTSHFEVFALGDGQEQDKRILRVEGAGGAERAYTALAVEVFNALLYTKAKEAYQGASKRTSVKEDKEDKPTRRQQSAGTDPADKPCSLCASTQHAYFAGHYGHTADMPITQRCPKLKNNVRCTLLHAFAGPLKTDCKFD